MNCSENIKIYLMGMNHKSAPVEVREKFALSSFDIAEQEFLSQNKNMREIYVLSTCNRVEIVVSGNQDAKIFEKITQYWVSLCGQNSELLEKHSYQLEGSSAIKHIFSVASSLDSMVLGEPQILGQMKEAYRRATKAKASKAVINRLMHKAFSVAKRVRTETSIASNAVSISYAAVELAKKIFGDLSQHNVMLIGAGEMAELAAIHLLRNGASKIYIANRTFERAQALATQLNGEAIVFDEFTKYLKDVDILISSTGAEEIIIHANQIKELAKKRKFKPLFCIDIAVPRDIEASVNDIDNVYLYDIDDLQEVIAENIANRQEEAQKAYALVENEVKIFQSWLQNLDLKPTIMDLFNQGDILLEQEIYRTLKRFGPNPDPKIVEAMEVLGHSLLQKVYHAPLTYLRRRCQEEKALDVINVVRRIFNLDHEEIPDDAHIDRKPRA